MIQLNMNGILKAFSISYENKVLIQNQLVKWFGHSLENIQKIKFCQGSKTDAFLHVAY